MSGPALHALLIGADGYFPNILSSGASYGSLAGCVNDVVRVEALLRQRVPEACLRVTTLRATEDEVVRGGDESAWPTAANIRSAFDLLIATAKPRDQVHIHYSGHGGRVSTGWPELKGDDGVDEALVPIDIGRPDQTGGYTYTRPERYVRDVELAFFLGQLSRNEVSVTLVLDACHSGGATRTVTAGTARCAQGGARLDQRRLAVTLPLAAEMGTTYARMRALPRRAATPIGTTWVPPSNDYVLLAACRDTESALELSIDGRVRSGVLTDSLLEALSALGTSHSWNTVYQRVLSRVQSYVPSQMPQLLGDLTRRVFGVDLLPVPQSLTVRSVDAKHRVVTCDGGLGLDITAGSALDIYRPGALDFTRADDKVATATVSDARMFECTAAIDSGADIASVEIGAPALVHRLSTRRYVKVVRDDKHPAAEREAHVLQAVEAAISMDGRGFLDVCPSGVTPHYQVGITAHSTVEISDAQGAPFEELHPVITVDDERVGVTIVNQLRRLARYQTLLGLAAPSSDLWDQLRVDLLVAPPTWRPGTSASQGGTPLALDGECYVVPNGTCLWLRIRNLMPSRPVNVALFNLSRTWDVELVVPNPTSKYESIADAPRTFAFRMDTQIDRSMDVMKLFVTSGDVDFRLLTAGTARTRNAVAPKSGLEQLFGAIAAGEHRTRGVTPVQSAGETWSVRELRICTTR